jgi:hypothetical protein
LAVLWVRSYWWNEYREFTTPTYRFEIWSHDGTLAVVQRTRIWISLEFLIEYPDDMMPALTEQTRLGIGWYYSDYFAGLSFAYWLLIPLCAMMGAVPWFTWRYSLRTFLLSLTLLALALGIIIARHQ